MWPPIRFSKSLKQASNSMWHATSWTSRKPRVAGAVVLGIITLFVPGTAGSEETKQPVFVLRQHRFGH